MSIYGSIYVSSLGLGRPLGLFQANLDEQYARWVIQTQEAMLNQTATDYERFRLVDGSDRLANFCPPWAIEAERSRYRAKAAAAGGDTAYCRELDTRITAARRAIQERGSRPHAPHRQDRVSKGMRQ